MCPRCSGGVADVGAPEGHSHPGRMTWRRVGGKFSAAPPVASGLTQLARCRGGDTELIVRQDPSECPGARLSWGWEVLVRGGVMGLPAPLRAARECRIQPTGGQRWRGAKERLSPALSVSSGLTHIQ